MDDWGGGVDLRQVLREHKRQESRGYGYYARLGGLDAPVFELTARERAKWATKLCLKYGDLVVCCGEMYKFLRVGGIDDGHVWIYAQGEFKNGNGKHEEIRLCVWRKLMKDGKLGKRQPASQFRKRRGQE